MQSYLQNKLSRNTRRQRLKEFKKLFNFHINNKIALAYNLKKIKQFIASSLIILKRFSDSKATVSQKIFKIIQSVYDEQLKELLCSLDTILLNENATLNFPYADSMMKYEIEKYEDEATFLLDLYTFPRVLKRINYKVKLFILLQKNKN